MLDDPKSLPAGGSRKRVYKPIRRVYVVANPNEETAGPSTPPFYSPPPLPNASMQYHDRQGPSPPQPSPINTDILKQKHQPRYNSDLALSSPSTTSSPALESTPPPSTPGQKSIPSIDLAQGSDRDNCQNPLISRTDNFVKKITAPFNHVRRRSSGNNVPPAAGCVRTVYFNPFHRSPNASVFSPQPITIKPPPPKPRSLTHL